jgi:hypothetical protein
LAKNGTRVRAPLPLIVMKIDQKKRPRGMVQSLFPTHSSKKNREIPHSRISSPKIPPFLKIPPHPRSTPRSVLT